VKLHKLYKLTRKRSTESFIALFFGQASRQASSYHANEEKRLSQEKKWTFFYDSSHFFAFNFQVSLRLLDVHKQSQQSQQATKRI